MVHALSEIRRVLVTDGLMIDLRPVSGHWPIGVISMSAVRGTGNLQDLDSCLRDDEAANHSMARAEQQRWFIRQAEDFFPMIYSWDTPSEMEEWIETEWSDAILLDDESKQATRSAWATADADARVQVIAKMLITRWRVAKEG